LAPITCQPGLIIIFAAIHITCENRNYQPQIRYKDYMFLEDKYIYKTNSSFLDFEFESTGPKGVIKKVARFTEIIINVYNFGFGDLHEVTGEINDSIISNNGDADKVLITIASIIYDFTTANEGSAEVFGLKNEKWELFRPGENYEAFLAQRKAAIAF
jgi:hypothetical protein